MGDEKSKNNVKCRAYLLLASIPDSSKVDVNS